MFGFIKGFFKPSASARLARRRKNAIRQDKELRESMSEKKIDRDVQDTMDASDPVTRY